MPDVAAGAFDRSLEARALGLLVRSCYGARDLVRAAGAVERALTTYRHTIRPCAAARILHAAGALADAEASTRSASLGTSRRRPG